MTTSATSRWTPAMVSLGVSAALALAFAGAGPAAAPAFNVRVTTVPSTVYTAPTEVYNDAATNPKDGHAVTQGLTWMFHLAFASAEPTPLRFEEARASFKRNGVTLWEESFSRPFLERMEWIQGEFELTTKYYLDHFRFGTDTPAGPDLPARGAVSWMRIGFARPWFAEADRVDFEFTLKNPAGKTGTLRHSVPFTNYRQKVKLRPPFSGTWVVVKGPDLNSGHRRTGMNGLTTYGWDAAKIGENGRLYRTDGKDPADYYTYGADVLVPGDGVVVHVRNEVPEDLKLTRDMLLKDPDLGPGNIVVIDHGQGEYTLTAHMQIGSIAVKVGDKVRSGQFLGRGGRTGFVHLNLMTDKVWHLAKGIPAVLSDFERVMLVPQTPPTRITLGNPITGWIIRAVETSPAQ